MSKHGRGHGNSGGHSGGHGGGHGSGYTSGHTSGHGARAPRDRYRDDDRYDAPRGAGYDGPPNYDEAGYRADAGRSDQPWQDRGYDPRASSGLRGPAVVLAMLAGVVVWTLVAWLGYVAVDPVMRWLAGSAGLLVDGGKAIAAVAGVGKEVGAVADGINTSGFIGQSLALIQAILKPLIVVGWGLGVIALIAAPLVLRRIGGLRRLRGMMRH